MTRSELSFPHFYINDCIRVYVAQQRIFNSPINYADFCRQSPLIARGVSRHASKFLNPFVGLAISEPRDEQTSSFSLSEESFKTLASRYEQAYSNKRDLTSEFADFNFCVARSLKEIKRYVSLLTQNGRWIYRGQRNADWTLQPTIIRKLNFGNIFQNLSNKGYADAVFQVVSAVDSEFYRLFKKGFIHPDADVFRNYSYAQHYGIPTRLLDWSKNYRVAAFFAAFEKSPTQDSSVNSTDGEIIACSPTKLSKAFIGAFNDLKASNPAIRFPENLDRSFARDYFKPNTPACQAILRRLLLLDGETPWVDEMLNDDELSDVLCAVPIAPKNFEARMSAQEGVFTLYMAKGYKNEAIDSEQLRHIFIPKECKRGILTELAESGINIREETIYPRFEKLAQDVSGLF